MMLERFERIVECVERVYNRVPSTSKEADLLCTALHEAWFCVDELKEIEARKEEDVRRIRELDD